MSAPLTFIVVTLLVGLSAVCSGLNVALMALDPDDLNRKAKLGDRRAQRVLPLRKSTHLSLSAILLTNIAAVSATSLVLDNVFYGVLAGVFATLLTVIFGEIFPQAYFLRNALKMTAALAPFLRLIIIISWPISRPIQVMLDHLFQDDEAHLQTRHELGLMLSEHIGANESELDEDEVEIMRGALQLSEKRVRDIMTPIEGVFWLTPRTVIDGELIDKIKQTGYSRIPIFNSEKTICFGILLVKQLVDIDFDKKPPHVDGLPLHPVRIVGSMTALDTMLRKFIVAHTHLAPIEKDDKIVGIVTIEDLIEEIVGHEIEDETDHHDS